MRGSEEVARSVRRLFGMRTAGKVPEALGLKRTVAEARLVQLVRSGELKLAARSYRAA